MDLTTNLQLPYIMPSQAQKHVTHNEAIRTLDALVQLAVLDRHLATPPASPAAGSRYLVATDAVGAWAGNDGRIAAWQDGSWAFFTPLPGWLIWVADELRLLAFDGDSFIDAAAHSVNPAPMIGVNATADEINRLSVKSPASLLDHEGGDHQLKINKALAADTASLLFQSNYSGRAEFGLAGDDDWTVKVSPDGASWVEAMKVDGASGRMTLPPALALEHADQIVTRRHIREALTANRTYHVRSDGSDGNEGLTDTPGGAFLTMQKAMDVIAAKLDLGPWVVTVQVADGAYAAGLSLKAYRATSGYVYFKGNTITPASVLISLAAGQPISNQTGASGYFKIEGFKLETASGRGLYIQGAGIYVEFGSMDFGACSIYQVESSYKARVKAVGDFTISGDALVCMWAGRQGLIELSSRTVTYLNNPAFLARNWHAGEQGWIDAFNVTFVNGASVTGKRYQAGGLSGIFTNGGGANYVPGDTAGTEASGGVYY